MYILLGVVIGAFLGDRRAARRGGNGLDRAQYGAVLGLIGAMAGLFVTVAINRMV